MAAKYDGSKRGGLGRPRAATELQTLVVTLARENTGWGYRIRDALRSLEVVTVTGLVRCHVFFVMDLASRIVVIVVIRAQPEPERPRGALRTFDQE